MGVILMAGRCKDCEFCFPNEDSGFVCADAHNGENISDFVDELKDCYSEGLDAFIKRSKNSEIPFISGIKLSQIKIDGRKQIELRDQEGKTIRIKASHAKMIMPNIEVERLIIDDTYVIKAVFDPKPFNGGMYLIVR
jgi:hypothetical protein